MDKDEEEEVSEVEVHEKGWNTVGFFEVALFSLYHHLHETAKGNDEQPPQRADYRYYWVGASYHRA